MGYVIKLVVISAGLIVIYGLVTGADLNQLFQNVMNEAIPFAKKLIASVAKFAGESLNQ